MKKIKLFVIFLFAASLFFSLESLSKADDGKSIKTLDIGITTPLTGPSANVGNNYKNGVLMAIAAQNAKGGVTIGGVKYLLNPVIRDTKFDPAIGKNVAEELVYSKKIKVIFGPSPVEGPSMTSITLPNKVILFGQSPIKQMCRPDQPFNFFLAGIPSEMYVPVCSYIQKFYPKAKTVLSIAPDLPDAPPWENAARTMCARYGLNFIGYEQFPFATTDFSPIAQRILAKNPDILDLSFCGGSLGAVCGVLVKQIRQAGFKGIIMQPTIPPPGIMDTIPKEYLNKIVSIDVNIDSPIVTKAYSEMYKEYTKRYGHKPINLAGLAFNGASAFFKFLDGQKNMDTTEWVEGFSKYKWVGTFGENSRWIGKPVFGIDRALITHFWGSEWKDGKLVTNWVAPIPYDMFESKQ